MFRGTKIDLQVGFQIGIQVGIQVRLEKKLMEVQVEVADLTREVEELAEVIRHRYQTDVIGLCSLSDQQGRVKINKISHKKWPTLS